MKYPFLIGILSILLLLCCTKADHPSTYNVYAITGTAYVPDYYSGTDDTVLYANKLVYIRVDSGNRDTANYFATIQTDNKGNFAFYVPDTTVAYELFITTTIKSSAAFSALYYASVITDSPYRANTIYKLVLSIDTINQYGLNVTTRDMNGQPISNAQVLFYTSDLVAIADSGFSGAGSTYKLTTDSLGRGFVEQLPAGTVYNIAWLEVNHIVFKSPLTTVTITQHAIVKDTLTLH